MKRLRKLELELVTHCYQYTNLLRYQLSSLILEPPRGILVKATVFYTNDDRDTVEALRWYGQYEVPNVVWNWQELPVLQLCRRSIGRNLAALSTNADWVWFTDADYWFAEECWRAFAGIESGGSSLLYPRGISIHLDHSMGNRMISNARREKGLLFADRAEFRYRRLRRAIGGVQIVSGDVCRSRGYLPNGRRAQMPATRAVFTRSISDVWFRRELGVGKRVPIPGIYRIRHSETGRKNPGLKL